MLFQFPPEVDQEIAEMLQAENDIFSGFAMIQLHPCALYGPALNLFLILYLPDDFYVGIGIFPPVPVVAPGFQMREFLFPEPERGGLASDYFGRFIDVVIKLRHGSRL